MKTSRHIRVLLSSLLLSLSLGQAMAQDWEGQRERGERRERAREQEDRGRGERGREAREERRGISLDQVVAMAERRFDARVVRAETRNEDGRTVYVLRLLNDAGRVWKVRVDAATGEFL